jgi:hypothetical protein
MVSYFRFIVVEVANYYDKICPYNLNCLLAIA